MKNFVVFGASDKARQIYAEGVAQNNGYRLEAFEAKDYLLFSKQFVTATLDGSKILYYVYDIENLPQSDFENLLTLIENSPHIFIFSCAVSPPFYIKKSCLLKPLDSKLDEISEALRALMFEKDRNAVRLAIANVDVMFLFHILKKDAWRNKESLQALSRISQKVFKCHNSYIVSLLAFAMPQKAFALSKSKKDRYPTREAILKKLAKCYKLNSCEAADLYQLISTVKLNPKEALLGDEEMSYLGILVDKADSQAQAAFSAVSPIKTLSEFF